jgi:hypothetical protein
LAVIERIFHHNGEQMCCGTEIEEPVEKTMLEENGQLVKGE